LFCLLVVCGRGGLSFGFCFFLRLFSLSLSLSLFLSLCLSLSRVFTFSLSIPSLNWHPTIGIHFGRVTMGCPVSVFLLFVFKFGFVCCSCCCCRVSKNFFFSDWFLVPRRRLHRKLPSILRLTLGVDSIQIRKRPRKPMIQKLVTDG